MSTSTTVPSATSPAALVAPDEDLRLRAEEIVSLRVCDVDHDGEQLRVEGKGRKTRYVPIGEPAMAALAAYRERARGALAGPGAPGGGSGDDALFLSKTGRALSTSDV